VDSVDILTCLHLDAAEALDELAQFGCRHFMRSQVLVNGFYSILAGASWFFPLFSGCTPAIACLEPPIPCWQRPCVPRSRFPRMSKTTPVLAARTRPALPANVKVLGLASLLNDIASEMIFPLLPNFLLTVLLGNRLYLGVVEGVADSVASL